MSKNKKFKCNLCGKKKSIKEKHHIYENNVCERCFNNLNRQVESIVPETNTNWLKDFIRRMNRQ